MERRVTDNVIHVDFARRAKMPSAADESVTVKEFGSHLGESVPIEFSVGDRALKVDSIEDVWNGKNHKYVKVKAAGELYIMRHDHLTGEWTYRALTEIF